MYVNKISKPHHYFINNVQGTKRTVVQLPQTTMSLCCCAMYVNVYIHYSLLILCAVVKYKMYEPPSLLQFGIHSYSTVGVQEFESLGKVFIIRHFKSQGGLRSKGRKEKQGAQESSFCIHCILPSKDYAVVAVICCKRKQFVL